MIRENKAKENPFQWKRSLKRSQNYATYNRLGNLSKLYNIRYPDTGVVILNIQSCEYGCIIRYLVRALFILLARCPDSEF